MNHAEPFSDDKGRVLLAEGHPASRRLIAALLGKLGFQVESVETGVDVLKKLEADPQEYELVMMNCRLPELDGPETAKAIRWLERQWDRRILIVALSADQHDRGDCLAAGADDALVGPVTLQSLRQLMDRIQSGRIAVGGGQTQAGLAEGRPILDAVSVEHLRRLNGEEGENFLSEVIDIFLRDSIVLMERIRAAAQAGDAAALRGAVHSLKGSSSTLGASRLAGICLRFEQELDRGAVSDVEKWVQQVEGAYGLTRQALLVERQR